MKQRKVLVVHPNTWTMSLSNMQQKYILKHLYQNLGQVKVDVLQLGVQLMMIVLCKKKKSVKERERVCVYMK